MAQHDDKEAERYAKEMGKYAALDEAEVNRQIQELLTTGPGRKLLWWLMRVSKYGHNPFSSDPSVMAFTAGEMNVGAQIMARIIEVNPMGFAQMQLESKQEDDRRTDSAKRLASGDDLFSSADYDSDS